MLPFGSHQAPTLSRRRATFEYRDWCFIASKQRQHRTSHAPKDELPSRICADYCAPCQPLLRAFEIAFKDPCHVCCEEHDKCMYVLKLTFCRDQTRFPAFRRTTFCTGVRSKYAQSSKTEKEFFIDNRLVRNHLILMMIRWTGLAPWEFEFPFPDGLASSFLRKHAFPKACKVLYGSAEQIRPPTPAAVIHENTDPPHVTKMYVQGHLPH